MFYIMYLKVEESVEEGTSGFKTQMSINISQIDYPKTIHGDIQMSLFFSKDGIHKDYGQVAVHI